MAWSNSFSITIDHTKVGASDSTNFPMFFGGTFPSLASTLFGGSVTNPAGFDIIFATDSLGASPIAFQRQAYSQASGSCEFWVFISTLSHTVDTVIYILFGNSAITTDQANPTGVWNSDFKGVWHLQTSNGVDVRDSTSNGNSGVSGNNGTTLPTAGTQIKFGRGGTLHATSGIYLPSFAISTFSVSAWVFPTSLSGQQCILGFSSAANGVAFQTRAGALSLVKQNVAIMLAGSVLTNNAWNYVACTYNSGTGAIVLRLNAGSGGTGSNSQTFTTGNYYIGFAGNGEDWIGTLDELRLTLGVVRSVDWFTAEYNNTNSPSTFYTTALTSSSPTSPWSFPVAPFNEPPITDADRGANHQTMRMPSSVGFLPSHFNPVPVAAVLAGGTTGSAYNETISAQGGTAPYTYAVTSGALPTGTSLNSTTGVISGTLSAVGTFSFTITVTDSLGFTGSTPFSIIVTAPVTAGGNSGFVA